MWKLLLYLVHPNEKGYEIEVKFKGYINAPMHPGCKLLLVVLISTCEIPEG
jgi:hypothetical protein